MTQLEFGDRVGWPAALCQAGGTPAELDDSRERQRRKAGEWGQVK